MKLSKMPIGAIFCRFDTGEFMSLHSNAEGIFRVENECGKVSTLTVAEAGKISCIQVGDSDLLSHFNRNAALGRALQNAERTAERILRESSPLSEEYAGALGVCRTAGKQMNFMTDRINQARSERSLGLNAARVFLYDLSQAGEGTQGVYLGHAVSYVNPQTIQIDNRTYPAHQAHGILAAARPTGVTFSLQHLLQNAMNRMHHDNHKPRPPKDKDTELIK